MKTMEKDDKAAGVVMMKTDDDDDNVFNKILEVTPSLELCTVIPRVEELKESFGGIRQTNKDFFLLVVNDYFVSPRRNGGRSLVIEVPPATGSWAVVIWSSWMAAPCRLLDDRASNTCYMFEDDYYLKQFEILKECPSMKGLCTHACMSIVVNTKNKGIFKTKVVLEEPMETPSLFFHVVPKVIFGGRHVILFRRKEGRQRSPCSRSLCSGKKSSIDRRREKADVAGKMKVVGGHCSDQPNTNDVGT
ncbi:hypothetical protein Tco_0633533 [Tanacetum coccineum]